MGIEERKERERTERRGMILRAAMQVYLEQGYHGTTMEKIAQKAELSRATLYIYFKTKDEIFVHAIGSFSGYFTGLLQDLYDRREQVKDGLLRELWQVFKKYFWKDPTTFHATLYFHQGEMIRGLTGDLRIVLDRTGSANYGKLCSIMDYGVGSGLFRKCDPRTLAEVVWTSFLGIVHIENSKTAMDRKNHLEMTFDLAYDILSRGILAPTVS
jgi:AcrR family transcriptional regulator